MHLGFFDCRATHKGDLEIAQICGERVFWQEIRKFGKFRCEKMRLTVEIVIGCATIESKEGDFG